MIKYDLDGKSSVSDMRLVRRTESFDIKYYPNPANELINISGLTKGELYTFEIVDANGILVSSTIKDGNDDHRIDLLDLHSGVYELLIIQNNQVLYQNRFIKIE